MISFQVVGDKAVVARLQTLPDRLRVVLIARMQAFTALMVGRVRREKLSGNPLHRRSGNLSASIRQDVQNTPASVIGRVYSDGTVPYAKVHEFGGAVTVPGHLAKGYSAKGRWQTMSQAFGRPIMPMAVYIPKHDVGSYVVRSYTYTAKVRSFLRTTLAESRDRFVTMVKGALREAAQL